MSKKIIIRYLKAYDLTTNRHSHRFDWWDGIKNQRTVYIPLWLDADDEMVHEHFEALLFHLQEKEGENAHNGIPLMIPNNVEGEIIET